jgi:hypothetical protein
LRFLPSVWLVLCEFDSSSVVLAINHLTYLLSFVGQIHFDCFRGNYFDDYDWVLLGSHSMGALLPRKYFTSIFSLSVFTYYVAR